MGVTAPPWPNLTPDHPQSPWDPHGAILDPKIGLLGPKSPGFGAVFSMSTGQLPGLKAQMLGSAAEREQELISELPPREPSGRAAAAAAAAALS